MFVRVTVCTADNEANTVRSEALFEAQRAENKAKDRTVFAECPLCTVTFFQNIFTGKKVLLIFPHRPVLFQILDEIQYFFRILDGIQYYFQILDGIQYYFQILEDVAMISYKALNTRTQIFGHAFWNITFRTMVKSCQYNSCVLDAMGLLR